MKRRGGETEKGGNGEKKKLPDSPILRFPDSPTHLQTGFTLLEVMVAVIILGFGLLAIMHLFPIGLRASKISWDTTVATFLAQQKIEELRDLKYANIDDTPSTGIFDSPFDNFTWTKSVSEWEDDRLSKVMIEVSYSPYGQGRKVKLVTFITNYKK